jgi:hypothetical protein
VVHTLTVGQDSLLSTECPPAVQLELCVRPLLPGNQRPAVGVTGDLNLISDADRPCTR